MFLGRRTMKTMIVDSEQTTETAQAGTQVETRAETRDEPGKRVEPARTATRPRVVVVGAGFGGMNAARSLAGTGVDVLVLDRNNYHGFWPLLYQVATAGLEPESIA